LEKSRFLAAARLEMTEKGNEIDRNNSLIKKAPAGLSRYCATRGPVFMRFTLRQQWEEETYSLGQALLAGRIISLRIHSAIAGILRGGRRGGIV